MLGSRLNRAFWDIYGSSAWDSVQLPINKKMIRSVVEILRERKSKSCEAILDAGCGTGNYALALAEEGYYVTGIDYSTGMLACAQSKVSPGLADRLVFEKHDMNELLSFPESSFDHVISMTSLWTVANPRFTLAELTRVTRPGGTMIVMQVPKPAKGICAAIQDRLKYLGRKSPGLIALIIIKAIIERTAATKYWSPGELLALLLSNKDLKISYIDHGPPIILVATKNPMKMPNDPTGSSST